MKLQNHAFIDQFLPEAWLYEDSILWIDHEDRLFASKGFEVQGQPISTLSPEHLQFWRTAAMGALNSLEQSTHLNFFWTIENDYSEFLEGHARTADGKAPALAKRLLEKRLDYFKDKQDELRHRSLFVFANFEPAPSQFKVVENLKLNAKTEHRMLLAEWKAARQKLEHLIQIARSPFHAAGMNTSLLNSRDILRLYRRELSPHRFRMGVGELKSNGPVRLFNETLVSDVERKGPFLFFDEHYHAFISMANLPQDTRPGLLEPLFNLSHSDYSLVVTLRTTNKQKEIRNLQSDYGSKQGLQNARQREGKIVNVEMETQAAEIREEIRTLTQTPQQIFNSHVGIHLMHPEEKALQARVDEANLKISYCGGAQGVLERIAAPEALRLCLPGWTREERLDRFQVIKSVTAADFIPNDTEFLGTKNPQALFDTPQGGMMTVTIFTAARPFHNVIVGETNGGKTFLINSISSQLVGQGLRSLTVISTKDEFGPLMAMYGGVKISFSKDENVFLNPCAIAGETPTRDEIEIMVAILETIFGDEPDKEKDHIRHSRILEATHAAFKERGKQTRLRHFVEIFRRGWEHDSAEDLKRLAMILKPFANGGVYGEYFDSDIRKQLDLSNPFKFFDFSAIQNNQKLAPVMMMVLTHGEALRLGLRPRSEKKALILDECWKFVNSAAGSKFIENALRVYRAYNCAVFLSTQVITDFTDSRLTPVVKTNCHNFFLLRCTDTETIEKMRQTLNLTRELAARFGVMPDPSEAGYSHFIYVHTGGAQQIAGEAINRIGREEGFLYSTSPNVSQLRDHLMEIEKDPWKAATRLAAMTREEIVNETARLNESRQTHPQPEPELISK